MPTDGGLGGGFGVSVMLGLQNRRQQVVVSGEDFNIKVLMEVAMVVVEGLISVGGGGGGDIGYQG